MHCIFTFAAGVKRKAREDFDPRAATDREPSYDAQRLAVQSLLTVFPDSGLGHLWGIHPQPPEATNFVELETTPTLNETAYNMILKPG